MAVHERRLVVRATAAAIAVLALGACARGQVREYRLEPAGGGAEATAASPTGPAAAARYLDADAIAEYARRKGLGGLGERLRTMPVAAFALRLENRGQVPVVADPRGLRLTYGGKERLSPLEYAHLYMELPQDSDRQALLRDLRNLLFEGTLEVRPGQAVERMVIFRRPEAFGPVGQLRVEGLYVGGAATEVVLDFVPVPLGR